MSRNAEINAEIAAVMTGERILAAYTDVHERPSHDEIAVLAYSFYELRGCGHGHDVDDWLAAELELTRHYE